MKNMLRDAAILFAITVIAGAVLGFVYDGTKEPIAQQEARAKQEACQEVFADASAFETVAEAGDASYGAILEAGYDKASIEEVMKAQSSTGDVLGYVMIVTSHDGDIRFSMGIRMDGTLNGISLLAISETPGLGMRAEEVLKPQFAEKQASVFAYTKTGAASEDQIDAISGATITTNAVVEALLFSECVGRGS